MSFKSLQVPQRCDSRLCNHSVDISAEISNTNPVRLNVQIVIPSNIIRQKLISLISSCSPVEGEIQ